MKFNSLDLKGAYILELENKDDSRGFFARSWCKKELSEKGLDTNIVQINNSLSKNKGTLRGLHYQSAPKAETKIVRCIRGSIWDVIVDIRSGSNSFGQWFGTEISSENRKMMYIPKGFAHGFISLEMNSEIIYLATEYYSPRHERGIRWNDPFHEISWPIEPKKISEKDSIIPNWKNSNAVNLIN